MQCALECQFLISEPAFLVLYILNFVFSMGASNIRVATSNIIYEAMYHVFYVTCAAVVVSLLLSSCCTSVCVVFIRFIAPSVGMHKLGAVGVFCLSGVPSSSLTGCHALWS